MSLDAGSLIKAVAAIAAPDATLMLSRPNLALTRSPAAPNATVLYAAAFQAGFCAPAKLCVYWPQLYQLIQQLLVIR